MVINEIIKIQIPHILEIFHRMGDLEIVVIIMSAIKCFVQSIVCLLYTSTQKGNGILEGKEYVVTWALGHLVTLADPEEYDKKYMKRCV